MDKTKPIIWNAEPYSLTIQYRAQHYGLLRNFVKIYPKMIVLHRTAIPRLTKSIKAFDSLNSPSFRGGVQNVGQPVFAHFAVGRNNSVNQLKPKTTINV